MSDLDDLIENYDQIAKSRDWTPEQMASYIESGDASLAAAYREQHSTRSSTPKERTSAPKDDADGAPKAPAKKAPAKKAPAKKSEG